MSLHLGFHYHIPALLQDSGIYMPGYLGRFVDSLAKHCNKVTCFLHSPSQSRGAQLDYRISASNVRLIDIGACNSVPQRQFLPWKYTQPLQAYREPLDVLLLRGPSPLLPAMARAAGKAPTALLLVGDYLAGVDDLPQPRWRKEAIRLWSNWNQIQQNSVARRSLTFVNSHLLYKQLAPFIPQIVETRTTTLSAADFFERDDTCFRRPYRLLYTGRIDRAKGLFEIIAALKILVNQGEDLVLDLVGWPAKGDPVLSELLAFADKHGVSERVQYHGYQPLGPQLFAYYRNADIYIIASLSNFEGFPRTIWEAMAHSLPVVATRVGSVPHFVQSAAELVVPGSVENLVAALRCLLHEPPRRQQLIRNGRELARQNTLEELSANMVARIEEWVRERNV